MTKSESLSPTPEATLPWTRTPLVLSGPLSKVAGCSVWLKLENLQPSGSFKSRGVGNLMRLAARVHPRASFYCSSGGNAGLACAVTAAALGRPATVVVPETTSAAMVERLRGLGAAVLRTGRCWAEADAHLRGDQLLGRDPDGVYVPPFDHPDIWAGVSTMVDEVAEQLGPEAAGSLRGIVCAVGGGGLMNGIVEGIEAGAAAGRWGRRDQPAAAAGPPPTVLAVETEGADSLNASVRAGAHITLPAITSMASSLGASRVSARTWEYACGGGGGSAAGAGAGAGDRDRDADGGEQEQAARIRGCYPDVVSAVVSDADAARAVVRFLDDARMLVEISCGAALAAAYRPGALRAWLGGGMADHEWARASVVVVICGGSAVSLALVDEYRARFGSA